MDRAVGVRRAALRSTAADLPAALAEVELVRSRVPLLGSTGAILVGKRMFDLGVDPWGDPPPFGMPVFVITHEPREPLPRKGGTTYFFETGGLEAALENAKSAAGEKDVGVWGGASVARQYLAASLLDEFQIHLVPILLGNGIRLFEALDSEPIELERIRTIETPRATHLRFRVAR